MDKNCGPDVKGVSHLVRKVGITVLCLGSLAGCSVFSSQSSPSAEKAWLSTGVLALSQPLPELSSGTVSASLFAFAPGMESALQSTEKAWVLVERTAQTISLMKGSSQVESFPAEGASQLPEGQFQLKHKQRSPVWYAPDAYFTARGLVPPPRGDKARFLRGALGDFALFLDKTTPLHSGPVWTPDIGGARLKETAISKLYYSVEPGTPVVVR